MYTLDLIGTFAFAYWGALKVGQRRSFFVLAGLCGFLTALGGGTLRELSTGHAPAYFANYHYLLVVLAGIIAARFCAHPGKNLRILLVGLDTLGLAVFSQIGVNRGLALGLGIGLAFVFGVLTALGGGVLADFAAGRNLQIHKDHASVAATLCAVILACALPNVSVWLLIAISLVARKAPSLLQRRRVAAGEFPAILRTRWLAFRGSR